jgi:hypothetical protein
MQKGKIKNHDNLVLDFKNKHTNNYQLLLITFMNNTIGSFVYEIKINSHNVIKHIEGVDKKVEKSDKTVKKLNNSFQNIGNTVKTMSLGFLGGAFAMNKLISSSGAFASNLKEISMQTGLSVENVQKLSNAYSVISGVSTSKAMSDVQKLAEQINNVKMGLANPLGLQIAGVRISAKTNVESAINDMRKRVEGLDDMKASMVIEKAGLGVDFLRFLRSSKEEIENIKSIDVISQDQIDNIIKAEQSTKILKLQILSLKNIAISSIFPVLIKGFGDLAKTINMNKEGITNFMSRVILFVKDFTIAVFNAMIFLGDTIKFLGSGKTGFATLIGLAFMLLKPIQLLRVAILAFADDYIVWKRGGEAMFGSIYNFISSISFLIKPLIMGFVAFGVAMKGWQLIKHLKNVTLIGGAFTGLVKSVSLLGQGILFLANLALPRLIQALGVLAFHPAFRALMLIGGAIYGTKKLIDYFSGDNKTPTTNDMKVADSIINTSKTGSFNYSGSDTVDYSKLIASLANKKSENQTITNNFTINANPGDDARDIANEVKKIIQEDLRIQNNMTSRR